MNFTNLLNKIKSNHQFEKYQKVLKGFNYKKNTLNIIKKGKAILNYESYNKDFLNLKNKLIVFKKSIFKIKDKNLFIEIQNIIENKAKAEDVEILLKNSTKWATNITWCLIGGTTFGIAWLAIAKTEEIIITQGKLEPISEVISIQMPLEGITNEILVKEGQTVKKNQLLVKLDTEITQTKYNLLKNRVDFQQDIVNRFKALQVSGAVSEIQYLQEKNKLAELKSQIKEKELIMKYKEIRSPVKGIVFDLIPKEKGFVARTSETILKIVPTGQLKASVEIQSRSIGFVSKGKKVDISIDSFPASDFGVIEGTIESISSDALQPDIRQGKGYRFPANITLNTQYLELKNGEKLSLQPGMSLTANIKLRKVTYLQLLLGTFSQKVDSLKSI